MRIHGSCVARAGAAVLVLGPPGSGKSDLVLRLIGRGWMLVADDQVLVEGRARVRAAQRCAACWKCAAWASSKGCRWPRVRRWRWPSISCRLTGSRGCPCRPPGRDAGVPRIALHGFEASACDKLDWALDAALGQRAQRAGAFAA